MGFDQLRRTIAECKGWEPILEYVDRLDGLAGGALSLRLDNAKVLLESVCKEICERHGVTTSRKSSLQGLVKTSAKALGIANSDADRPFIGALATLAQETGELRNRFGVVGHGRTMAELQSVNSALDQWTQNLVFSAVEAISVFFLEVDYSRSDEKGIVDSPDQEPVQEFDEYWDNQYGELEMGDYSYTSSEILRVVDPRAYQYEVLRFKSYQT